MITITQAILTFLFFCAICVAWLKYSGLRCDLKELEEENQDLRSTIKSLESRPIEKVHPTIPLYAITYDRLSSYQADLSEGLATLPDDSPFLAALLFDHQVQASVASESACNPQLNPDIRLFYNGQSVAHRDHAQRLENLRQQGQDVQRRNRMMGYKP